MDKKVKRNYVNNKDLYDALVAYKSRCEDARSQGTEIPQVPNYIGHCINDIATRISFRDNFSGYPFRSDMVQDGVENCLRYIENFNPNVAQKNPFGWFSRIIWYAFLRRIAKEKKQLYLKLKSSQSMLSLGETYSGGEDIAIHLNLDADYVDSFIQDYEDSEKKKKDKI